MRDLGSFGREPAPPDPELLLQAILAFVRARTWSESRRVVEERPELLSDAADALLGQLIAAQEDADVRRYLEEHRALLRRCREVGVERAFREKMEALARSLSAAPSEEEIRRHPLYQLAEMVLRGELTLEAARQRAIAPDTLRALDDRSIDRMDDYIIALSRNPARPIGTRIRAYVLAELNHAAAQALPASPPIRAYTANTLGNCIDDYPFKTPAHLERRVEAYREALAIWQQEGDPRRVAMIQNNLGNAYLRSWRRFGIGRGTWSGRLRPIGRRSPSTPRRPPRWSMPPPRTTWAPPTRSWRRFGIGRGTWSGRLPPTGRRSPSTPRRPPRWSMR
jgi:hypothetical protein